MFESNAYFDGNVKSIALETADGPATIGAMAAGEYTFGTSKAETMKVVSGVMEVKLPGSDQWVAYCAGEQFMIAANQSFDVRIKAPVAYLCLYK